MSHPSPPAPGTPNLFSPGTSPDGRARQRRSPLGLPAGSVRALLALMILGLVWILMLLPPDRFVQIPLYLYYLMFLIVGHYYAAHGHTIAGPATGPQSPLYLPSGTIRVLIILGFAAVLGYRYYTGRDWKELIPAQPDQPLLPLVLLGAFFLGILTSRAVGAVSGGSGSAPYWYHDIQAWLAILAGLGLTAEVLIQAVINPTMPADRQIQLPQLQIILTGIVGFYFGARS